MVFTPCPPHPPASLKSVRIRTYLVVCQASLGPQRLIDVVITSPT